MTILESQSKHSSAPVLIRRALIAWLVSSTVETLLCSVRLNALQTLGRIQPLRMGIIAAVVLGILYLLPLIYKNDTADRWILLGSFSMLAAISLVSSFSPGLLAACLLMLIILSFYVINGWNSTQTKPQIHIYQSGVYLWMTAGATAVFFLVLCLWTVGRVRSFSTPTYDFGIFSQMFHSMKTTGLPMTTVERDGLLSHFAVHVSPIYYLLLPVYYLIPRPETLQVLQALVLASAVIPLWKLGNLHGLNPFYQMLACLLLVFYPAYSGGASYDIHENAFLTPLLLWLFYGIDRKNIPVTLVSAFLTLTVKEDAAVYVAVIALWLLVRFLVKNENRRDLLMGISLLAASLLWFWGVTSYLASRGDGVMSYRYRNFMYDGSDSLLTVIKAVILCPMKAVYECMDREKLSFLLLTLVPLLGLPLLTRRYERYILLIPYILVNLMSDYQYQHDIFFQYTFGATACLFYLTVVNLADIQPDPKRLALLAGAVVVSLSIYAVKILPTALHYPSYCLQYQAHYDQIRATLDTIPKDASVAATTFYTTYLSQRDTLYDIRYTTKEHLLSCEYVVLNAADSADYQSYGKDGLNSLISLLQNRGYTLHAEYPGKIQIYRKQ